MTNRVLITGVYGFCARHLVMRLIAEGFDNIYGGDIYSDRPEGFALKEYIKMDITDNSNVNDVVQSVKPDMIFHLAGITNGDTSAVYHVNFMGSVYLLEAIRKWAPQSRVLLVGSAAEYGYVPEREMPICETHQCNPVTPYGISKYAMTLAAMNYVAKYGVKVVIARPFNIVGANIPESLVIGAVLSRIKKALATGKEPVTVAVGNLDTKRDFITVEDMAEAYLAMIRSHCNGEIFNICSGRPLAVRDVLLSLASNSKKKLKFHEDISLVRGLDVHCVYGNGEKSRQLLGFFPQRSLEKALKAAWDAAAIRDN